MLKKFIKSCLYKIWILNFTFIAVNSFDFENKSFMTYNQFPDIETTSGSLVIPAISNNIIDSGLNSAYLDTGYERNIYRLSFTVNEPYQKEFETQQEEKFQRFASNLTKILESVLSENLKEKPRIELIKIENASDPFESKVYLDIHTLDTESTLRSILAEHFETYHSLGKLTVRPSSLRLRTIFVVYSNRSNGQGVKIQVSPAKWSGLDGDTVKLLCSTTNIVENIVWSRSNQSLPKSAIQIGGLFVISNPSYEDAGWYICTVTLLDGTQKKVITSVTVQPRYRTPFISIEPSKQKIKQGANVTIHCKVIIENVSIEWLKNDIPYFGDNILIQNNSLRIINANIQNSGLYTCKIVQNLQTYYQAVSFIEVEPQELPVLRIQPKVMQTVLEGGFVEFYCNTIAGIPLPKITWFRQGNLTFGPTSKIFSSGLLQIYNITANDEGTYVCVAENSIGIVNSTAEVQILSLPVLTIKPRGKLQLNVGDKLHIVCYASGNPPASVSWKKENDDQFYTDVFKSSMISSSAILDIDNVSKIDEGRYICRASSLTGTIEDFVQLIVEDNVSQEKSKEDCQADKKCISNLENKDTKIKFYEDKKIIVPSNSKITIRCLHSPNLNINNIYYSWSRKNGRALSQKSFVNDSILFINNVDSEDTGNYVCSGWSDNGENVFSDTIHLNVFDICSESQCMELHSYNCNCFHGWTSYACKYFKNIKTPRLNHSRSYLAYKSPASTRLKVTLNLKPEKNSNGIIMYYAQNKHGTGYFIGLILDKTFLRLIFDLGSGVMELHSNKSLQNGKWYDVILSKDYNSISLTLDSQFSVNKTFNSSSLLALPKFRTLIYIGGIDNTKITVNQNIKVLSSFQGCLDKISLYSNKDDLLQLVARSHIEECSTIAKENKNNLKSQVTIKTAVSENEISLSEGKKCISSSCVHGTCQVKKTNDYFCTCKPGYSGKNCDEIIDKCEFLKPCMNGGSCRYSSPISYECDCIFGYFGQNCSEKADMKNNFYFEGNGWLELNYSTVSLSNKNEIIQFQISTDKPSGLIMWHGDHSNSYDNSNFISLSVRNGFVECQIKFDKDVTLLKIKHKVNDGRSHSIILKKNEENISIELDGRYAESALIQTLSWQQKIKKLFIGGVPEFYLTKEKYLDGFSGCIQILKNQTFESDNFKNMVVGFNKVFPCRRYKKIQ